MADRGAFMKDDAVCGFELFDDGTVAIACGFDDADPFFDDNAGIGVVIWGYEGREEGQVNSEGGGGEGSASTDLGAKIFGRGLSKGCELVKSALGCCR